jgi:hypothetical protein
MDVIALKAGEIPRFIQVKGTKEPFSGFSPFERYDLLAEAQKAGARAELAWWPAYASGPEYISPEDWPETIQPKTVQEILEADHGRQHFGSKDPI